MLGHIASFLKLMLLFAKNGKTDQQKNINYIITVLKSNIIEIFPLVLKYFNIEKKISLNDLTFWSNIDNISDVCKIFMKLSLAEQKLHFFYYTLYGFRDFISLMVDIVCRNEIISKKSKTLQELRSLIKHYLDIKKNINNKINSYVFSKMFDKVVGNNPKLKRKSGHFSHSDKIRAKVQVFIFRDYLLRKKKKENQKDIYVTEKRIKELMPLIKGKMVEYGKAVKNYGNFIKTKLEETEIV